MKKIFLLLIVIFFNIVTSSYAAKKISVDAISSILIDYHTNDVLYEDNDIKCLTLAELDKLKIIGTGSSLDGSAALLTMVQSDDTRRFKTSMAIPSHITVTTT